jgi:hypothetical protein
MLSDDSDQDDQPQEAKKGQENPSGTSLVRLNKRNQKGIDKYTYIKENTYIVSGSNKKADKKDSPVTESIKLKPESEIQIQPKRRHTTQDPATNLSSEPTLGEKTQDKRKHFRGKGKKTIKM